MNWKPLEKTDYIDVLWPSAAPSLKEGVSLEHFMEELNQVVQSYGLAGIHYNVNDVNPSASFEGYYAHSDACRAKSLQEALLNPNTKAIWTGRGGYGAAEVIQIYEKEGFTLPLDRVIPLIGFSDFTAFHSLATQSKWPTLHGPMANFNKEMHALAAEEVNDQTSIQSLIDILKGEVQEVSYSLQNLNPEARGQAHFSDPISTKIIGSNFSVVQRSNGTATQLNAKGAILFFEDTQVNINTLRSVLTSVARTGMIDEALALFFGALPIDGGTLEAVLTDFATTLKEVRGVNLPILLNPSFGHGAINQVLPLGTLTTLEFQPDGNASIRVSTNQSAYTPEGRR